MKETSEKSRLYELSMLFRDAESEPAISRYFEDAGIAVQEKSQLLGVRLAYPIKRQQSAHFGFYRFWFYNFSMRPFMDLFW